MAALESHHTVALAPLGSTASTASIAIISAIVDENGPPLVAPAIATTLAVSSASWNLNINMDISVAVESLEREAYVRVKDSPFLVTKAK
ncbi:hypothetical protein IWW57_000883 [Coemansia sp. S610]|nr:hypothetical protein IWW57_000883 [Coemansia sp. S610]